MQPSCILGLAFVHRHLNSPCSSLRHLKTRCCTSSDGLHTFGWVAHLRMGLPFCGNHTKTALSSLGIAEEEGEGKTVLAQPCKGWSTYQEVRSVPSSAEVVSTPCNHTAAELTSLMLLMQFIRQLFWDKFCVTGAEVSICP